MSNRLGMTACIKLAFLFAGVCGAALAPAAETIGQVKVVNGSATVERVGHVETAKTGTPVRQFDTVRTGPDSSIGMTFVDNTVMSLGPNSVLYLDRFVFNPTTHEGRFDSVIRKGTLSVISGKIAKQSPDAVSVQTPTSVLGVRGTEFFVQVDAPQ
jgi:hypothetical protein